jgi:hypothetical protein
MSTRRSAVGQGRSAGTELSLSVQGGCGAQTVWAFEGAAVDDGQTRFNVVEDGQVERCLVASGQPWTGTLTHPRRFQARTDACQRIAQRPACRRPNKTNETLVALSAEASLLWKTLPLSPRPAHLAW